MRDFVINKTLNNFPNHYHSKITMKILMTYQSFRSDSFPFTYLCQMLFSSKNYQKKKYAC